MKTINVVFNPEKNYKNVSYVEKIGKEEIQPLCVYVTVDTASHEFKAADVKAGSHKEKISQTLFRRLDSNVWIDSKAYGARSLMLGTVPLSIFIINLERMQTYVKFYFIFFFA